MWICEKSEMKKREKHLLLLLIDYVCIKAMRCISQETLFQYLFWNFQCGTWSRNKLSWSLDVFLLPFFFLYFKNFPLFWHFPVTFVKSMQCSAKIVNTLFFVILYLWFPFLLFSIVPRPLQYENKKWYIPVSDFPPSYESKPIFCIAGSIECE